ncbi:MAG: hypothetical protein ACOYVD_11225 [Bacillota bacterium]
MVFFHQASINLREVGDFSLLSLPETPILVFIILFALICASAVRNGIEIITRCSLILVPVTVYLPLVLPIGVLMVINNIMQFENMVEFFHFANEICPFYSIPFQIAIPLFSLIIAMIRGLPKKKMP